MNTFQTGTVGLVKSALTGEKSFLPEDFNWTSALELAKKHSIVPLIYYGVIYSAAEVPENVLSELEDISYRCVSVTCNQLYELENIYSAFDESGIDYMPLKGAEIKNLYPKPEMRSMGDADVLIKPEQYEKIRVVLHGLEFEEKLESDHEFIWNKNGLHLELHKRLIPSYNRDYYAYYGDGWDFARRINQGRFTMSDEDTFIYLFTHYAKHYRDGGIGIRHITDLYVYLSAKPDLDKKYIETELEKLKLLDFYRNIVHTVGVWFCDGQGDDMSDFITEKIFESGSYGTYVSHIISGAYRLSTPGVNIKNKKVRNLMFLPYEHMCKKYPVLKKVPFLLPVMWVVRAINAVFTKRDKIAAQRKELEYITEERIEKYKTELNFVGLDFNFKE